MAENKLSYPQTMSQPEAGSCQVLLIRHGQSAPYVDGEPFPLVEGHGDPPLSPLGRWQADRLGERLVTEPLTAIYVSSLTRTHQTAAPLARSLGIEPRVRRDLREVFLGELEAGLFRRKAAENDPIIAEFRRTKEWGTIPGAETNARLQERVVGSVQDVANSHPDEMVAVVCHGGVIASLLAYAMGRCDFSFMGLRNASLSLLSVSPSEWKIRSYNDVAHCGSLTEDQPLPN